MSLDNYRRYDWNSLIGISSIEDKIRLIVDDKTREVNEIYREWKKHGKGSVVALMMRYFDNDPALEREYKRWLDALGIPHMYKDDRTLLKFLNHKRWETEYHLVARG